LRGVIGMATATGTIVHDYIFATTFGQ
jgi:hypothetical protein